MTMMMILLRSENVDERFTLGYLHLHLDNRDGSGRGACHQQHGEVRQPISSRKESETFLSFYMSLCQKSTSAISLLKISQCHTRSDVVGKQWGKLETVSS